MDITQFITDHSPGKSEAGRMLERLVAAVKDTGKGGSMTLVIKIEPDKTQPTALLISDEITAKLPKHERPVRKAWLTPSGLVVDFDPLAPSLPGMAVDGAGKLVDEQDVAAGAAHFLQHTSGVVRFTEGGVPLVIEPGIFHTPDDGNPGDVPVEEDAEAVEEAEAEPLPGEALGAALVAAAAAQEPAEDEEAADVDPRNPFALTDARKLRVVKDQPQA